MTNLTPLSPELTAPIHYVESESLYHASIAQGIQSICVTSTTPREGVSMVAYSLAKRSAASGKRTLLMDANLHNPCVAGRLGITERLWDGSLEHVHDAIHHFDGVNLSILPALNKPIAPVQLRDPAYLQQLTQSLVEQFDSIVIDAEPIMMQAQHGIPSTQLAKYCDACVMVVQAATTPEGQLMQALEMLNKAQAPVLGTVLNRQHTRTLSSELADVTASWKRFGITGRLREKVLSKLRGIESAL